MKYSNTALKILKRRYMSVLLKCAMINAAIFIAAANPVNAAYICEESGNCTLTGNLIIENIDNLVMKGNLIGGTGNVGIYTSDSNKFPSVTWEGKIDGFEGGFKTGYDDRYEKYSILKFKNWNPEQVFRFGTSNGECAGFFEFDNNNAFSSDSNDNIVTLGEELDSAVKHIFLNGNKVSEKSSENIFTNLYLGGFMTNSTGYTETVDGYKFKNVFFYAGGLRSNIDGDISVTIRNSEFSYVYGNGQAQNVKGNINLTIENSNISNMIVGNYSLTDDFIDDGIDYTKISSSFVDGDINMKMKNSKATSVYGQQFIAAGNAKTGLGGTITIDVENSQIAKDLRGYIVTTNNNYDWLSNYLNINDIVLNVSNSQIGEEIVGVGSYLSAKDVTINIYGNSSVGYDENGNAQGDGWIIAGTSRAGGTIENTTINLDTQGANNIINVAGHVEVGGRAKDGYMGNINDETYKPSVLGNAELNILGGGIVNVGAFRADHIAGTASFNLSKVKANAKDDVIGFDEINMDNQSVLTAGTLSMDKDGEVNVVLSDEDNHSQIVVDELDVNGAAINMEIGGVGVYDLIKATTTTSDFTWDLTSNLYIITEDDGTVTVRLKSSDQIAEDLGVSKEQTDIILGVIDAVDDGTEKGQELAEALKNAIDNGNKEKTVIGARQIAPTNSQLIRGVAQETANILARSSSKRVDTIGEKQDPANRLWVEAVSGIAKQDHSGNNDGFSADMNGVIFGYDNNINENTVAGIGYGYMNTKADSLGRDFDIDSHNFFVYGKYQPSQWYVSSVLSYGFGEYEESKSPFGVSLKGEFDVNSYYAHIMSGYEFANGITPEAGLRYLVADADSYFDGAQTISQEKEDNVTAVAGIKYSKTFLTESSYIIKPNVRLAATYDVLADDNSSNVSVYGGGKYRVNNERLSRLGVEAGVGVTASFEKWDLSLDYNGAFRDDYNAQSGMITIKYKF